MDLSDAQILLLKTTANYLNSEILNYIRSNAKVEEIVARISDLVDTAASDIPTIKIDPKLGFSWLNKFLLRKGYLGKYFDSDFFPLKQISNINPDTMNSHRTWLDKLCQHWTRQEQSLTSTRS